MSSCAGAEGRDGTPKHVISYAGPYCECIFTLYMSESSSCFPLIVFILPVQDKDD